MGATQSPTLQGAETGMGKFLMSSVHTPVPWSQLAVTGFCWIRFTMRITSARERHALQGSGLGCSTGRAPLPQGRL